MAIRSDSAGHEQSYLRDMLAADVGDVLEIGCGDGRLTRKYADLPRRIVGVDLLNALPGTGAKPFPESISMAAASGLHLPFPACRFDHVIFSLSF